MAEKNSPDRKNRKKKPDGENYAPPDSSFDNSTYGYDQQGGLNEGYNQQLDSSYSPSQQPLQPPYPAQSGYGIDSSNPSYNSAPMDQPPSFRPKPYSEQPYSQPTQFSPEGSPDFQNYPNEAPDYIPPALGGPPYRRPPGYQPYPPNPRNVPPGGYRPVTPLSEEYTVPPEYVPAPRRITWGENAEPVAESRGPGWLMPLLISLITLLIISGIVIAILLINKDDNAGVKQVSVPTVVVSQKSSATPITENTALAVLPNQTALTSAATPTLALVGTSLQPTSTPGAGAATQLAIFNATLTAQVTGRPALTPSPNATANLTAMAFLTAIPNSSVTPNGSVTPSVSGTAGGDVEQNYQAGMQALSQGQWQAAITALEQVENSQPKYKDTETLLLQAYDEQGKAGVNDAQTVQDVQASRQYFEKALALKPNDVDTKRLIQELDYYYNGRLQYEGNHWVQAINNLVPLFKLEPAYKDATQLLYTAYLNQGDLLASQNRPADALVNYRNALSLPISDTSLAQQKLDQTQLLLTPTATALPTATPKPVATPTPVPTATTALVNGCPVGYFNFGPYNVNSTPPYSGPDQGKSSVSGFVINTAHQSIPGAVVQILSSNGAYSFTATTGADGRFSFVREIGRDTWTVKLLSAPGISICYSASASVTVSGQDGARAEANFVQTKP